MTENEDLDYILDDDSYEKYKVDTDKEVDEMLHSWDKVTCKYCGKEISMLNARIIRDNNGYESFVCRSH